MIEKNIKDYLHLYLGCELFEVGGGIGKLYNMGTFAGSIVQVFTDCSSNEPYWTNVRNVKPILRPLSDMTDEEKNYFELWSFEIMKEDLNQVQRNALKIKWYLYNHFDLFGLIEAGLAIDKTTIKKYENESRT